MVRHPVRTLAEFLKHSKSFIKMSQRYEGLGVYRIPGTALFLLGRSLKALKRREFNKTTTSVYVDSVNSCLVIQSDKPKFCYRLRGLVL